MSEKKTELKREMGLFSSVCVLVGCVIGSGIFTTPGNIAASAGSFGPNMLACLGDCRRQRCALRPCLRRACTCDAESGRRLRLH